MLIMLSKLDNRKLPSIRNLLNDYPPTDRRFSEPSMHSLVSGSSTPSLSHLDLKAASPQAWFCNFCGDKFRNATGQEAGMCSTCSTTTPAYNPHETSVVHRLQQNAGQVTGQYPYPTPANSPVEASMRVRNSSGSRHSPRHWRYEESSDSARSRQDSESSETEKPKTKKERNKKAEREYCGRQQLSSWMADLQNVCLEVNPNMATLAAPRPSVPNGGWRPLKSNNINKDMDNPLSVNKTDALASSITVIHQSNVLFAQIIELLRDEGKNDLAREVAESVGNRGCMGFRLLGKPKL